jgi:hypothetical protein
MPADAPAVDVLSVQDMQSIGMDGGADHRPDWLTVFALVKQDNDFTSSRHIRQIVVVFGSADVAFIAFFGFSLSFKGFNLIREAIPFYACLPFTAALAKRSHFLILSWTGVGQTGFLKPPKRLIC